MKLVENTDFELIPHKDDAWQVRILTGDFVETVIEFGLVRIVGTEEDPLLSFDFVVISSPIAGLTAEDTALQDQATAIIVSIIEDAIENKNGDIAFEQQP